jgi:hypothetical protein
MEKVDVAVIGAGLAGLTCAQQLRQAGYQVVVLEKSRGLGGRAATRRLLNTCADHGLRYLDSQGARSQFLIDRLLSTGDIALWTESTHTLSASGQLSVDSDRHPRYVAPDGMSTIAKALAIHLDVRRNHRVVAITPAPEGWKFAVESDPAVASPIVARSLVIAIPAPQALTLLEPLTNSAELDSTKLGFTELEKMRVKLRSVQFDPCVTAIAAYPVTRLADSQSLEWKALTLENDPILKWIGRDSSKRPDASQPVFVLHSTATFAKQQFDAPVLQAVGQQMLDRAAQKSAPWLNEVERLQVHRWRYAFVSQSLSESCLVSQTPQPIVCCGEWCGEWCSGQQVEAALESGAAAATHLENVLKRSAT